ncbi:F0F1 ATP synthase subunit delta [Polaromonas naphthalenivorans]|uniref:ATP synthase subunit delta n=1 Tax=Polaromonas naphthalenivorans (strain CJ2) TaxID=365044 RepID=ATPD_POLNA|nr:F0F1 ATP synthase subunit delta [Polaromonas naphthalenivorans]A1VIU9.1 RecName: Full=ATP synthase subunit delta; AltName: Full=ATP synthase F(1) sector subunit delta; AltName: Full=F-type ATPase subunit delta; Short=F-ATPase subunit delta [Polaromonas naphthalenivorans CJ2]ABM35577.1 ATP synthase F1 subcomplex delta subunit [Polaromonas naphthalenivorans CJ2]MBH2009133.1 F0F1 ATP synthase subunit delta [Xanthomonadaceae bacterium]
MAELATIARPYADALYKAQGSDLATTALWVDKLAAVAGNAQLLQFADSPKVSVDQVFDVVAGVASNANDPLPEAARNFLRLVIENGRLSALPEIASQFRSLKNAAGGMTDAVVFSAFPMDEQALNDIAAVLEKRFGRKLGIKVELDPSLIGGIRAVVGDEVLDTSVKARLEQMKMALIA